MARRQQWAEEIDCVLELEFSRDFAADGGLECRDGRCIRVSDGEGRWVLFPSADKVGRQVAHNCEYNQEIVPEQSDPRDWDAAGGDGQIVRHGWELAAGPHTFPLHRVRSRCDGRTLCMRWALESSAPVISKRAPSQRCAK